MRVILYPRVSSKSQLEGDSIDAQILRLTNFCKNKGYEIVGIYTDAGKSASIDEESLNQNVNDNFFTNSFKLNKRPAFKRLLQEAKEKKFDAIIFFRWDRYSRDIAFADLSYRYFKQYGIRLIPSDDSEDPFVSSIMQVVNKQEIDKMKSRVRQTRIYRFEQGMLTGRSPFGYKPLIRDKKVVGFTIHQKQAEIVLDCFKMASEGHSYKEICKKHGLKPQSYYNIIKNKVYIGIIKFENIEKEGKHEKIISKELWEKVNGKD